MPFTIVRQDITKMKVDAIVNAANTQLAMGGGVCGAIFKAAGQKDMALACNDLAPVQTGEAAITPGFNLDAKYVIHAVGPIYSQWPPLESEKLLRSAYLNSLDLAKNYKCESIAFPLISSGIYGYPKEEALEVATNAIKEFLTNNDMDVYLVVFDRASFSVSQSLMEDVQNFVDEKYVEEQVKAETFRSLKREMLGSLDFKTATQAPMASQAGAEPAVIQEYSPDQAEYGLDRIVDNLDEAFSETLFRLIDSTGKSDPEIYKKANIDRRLFSKIRSAKGYTPSKRTILALAIALELDLNQTNDLLKRAGYTLSRSYLFDVIIEYFIIKGMYDVFEINNVLFKYDQALLGA